VLKGWPLLAVSVKFSAFRRQLTVAGQADASKVSFLARRCIYVRGQLPKFYSTPLRKGAIARNETAGRRMLAGFVK
jgi:hypothetical protein